MKKIIISFTLSTCFIFGCAANKDIVVPDKGMPEVQAALAAAKTAIAEAKSAGAEKYAKVLLDSAKAELMLAVSALKNDDKKLALASAGKSLAAALKAKARALAEFALEKAGAEIKAAEEAGAEIKAAELLSLAKKDYRAAQKEQNEKNYDEMLVFAKKAYEEAGEARRLCGLIKTAEDAIAQAKEDIAEALKAHAKVNAPELLNSAEANLKKAISAFSNKDYIKAVDYAAKASDDAKAARAAGVAAITGKYMVKGGDNLWNIAKDVKVLDNPFLWPLIYKTNREKIKNPELIFPAQEFELPAPFDELIKDAAVGEAFKYKK
ncbi:MAG: hypothetical protein NTX32_03635 [Candidatus Firestonebacteria bacterium]|nr:hypothetical protein [Candidatus Firestonebacteria bacterium]